MVCKLRLLFRGWGWGESIEGDSSPGSAHGHSSPFSIHATQLPGYHSHGGEVAAWVMAPSSLCSKLPGLCLFPAWLGGFDTFEPVSLDLKWGADIHLAQL